MRLEGRMFRGGYERAQMWTRLQMLARLWDSEELRKACLAHVFSSTILGEFISTRP